MRLLATVLCMCVAGGSTAAAPSRNRRAVLDHVSSWDRPLNVTTIVEAPFMYCKNTPGTGEPTNAQFSGHIKDVLDDLSRNLGFEYKLSLVPDSRYGSRLANGSWNGLIGEIIAQRADIAAAALTVTPVRADVVDFTMPLMRTSLGFLSTQPDVVGYGSVTLPLRPFSVGVWLLSLAVWIVVWAVMVVINKFSPYEWATKTENGTADKMQGEFYNIQNSAFTVSGLLFLQGYEHRPASVSGRILLVGWFMFVAVFAVTYAACLTVTLMSTEPRLSSELWFDGQALLDSGKDFGFVTGGSTQAFFKSSTVDLHAKMYQRVMDRNTFVKNSAEGVRRVRDGDYVFIGEKIMLIHNANQDCRMMVVDARMDERFYALAVPPGRDPLLRDLNMALADMRIRGMRRKLYRKWFVEKSKCKRNPMVTEPAVSEQNTDTASTLPLTADRFALVFVSITVFIVVAVIAMLIEIVYSKSDRSIRSVRMDRNDDTQILQ